MLTRIYANNFRCLMNFELHLGSVALLMGPNDAGKSTIFDLIERIRAFVADGCRIDETFGREHLTSWQDRHEQQFELEIAGESEKYTYHLRVEHYLEKRRVRVGEESLRYGERTLFEFSAKTGKARLYRDDGSAGGEYLFDWSRSRIAALHERPENKLLTWFKKRLGDILVVRPNPMSIGAETREETERPNIAFIDFASWYRFLSQERPDPVMRLHSALREVIPDFDVLRLRQAGEGKLLEAVFAMETPWPRRAYRLNELSDGQRALIVLYALIHCLPESGATLCIDEPKNCVALPEIQPWLDEFNTLCSEGSHQGLLISHHPRLINLLAREAGLWIDRSSSASPTRIRSVGAAGEETGIAMDQLVERGWICDD